MKILPNELWNWRKSEIHDRSIAFTYDLLRQHKVNESTPNETQTAWDYGTNEEKYNIKEIYFSVVKGEVQTNIINDK